MGPDDWNYVIALACLIFCSGLSSGSETAFFSLENGQLTGFRFAPSRTKQRVAALMDDSDTLLLTILILNNVINVSYFALISAWSASHDASIGATIALGGLLALILLGEILPKVLANSAAPTFAQLTCWPLNGVIFCLTPVNKLVTRFLSDSSAAPETGLVSSDELKVVIEQTKEHGVVSEMVHDRMMEVIDLSETPVHAVMTHRMDCVQADVQESREKVIDILKEKPVAFIIMVDEQDECAGLLAVQDLLKGGRPSKRMRKPLFIPGNANLAQAITLFKNNKRNAGVVVDEYGGTLGLLTLAHIGNELLGPGSHADLPDQVEPEQIDKSKWVVPGRLPIAGWEPLLQEDDIYGCTTIGGFVSKMLGAVPQAGDSLLYGNLLFRVNELNGRRIGTVTIEKLPHVKARRMSQEFKVRK